MQIKVLDLGLTDYFSAWETQKDIFQEVRQGRLESALILCQHRPVITLGRLAKRENIRFSEEQLKQKGIEMFAVERGGDVTYHGPGQIVAYPIFNLSLFKKDIHYFLRKLEEVILVFLSDFGISGLRKAGLTGVWIGEKKIASLGISVRNWITFHGLSINIRKDDLENFHMIRPCGMDIEITSLESLLGRRIDTGIIKDKIVGNFKTVFGF